MNYKHVVGSHPIRFTHKKIFYHAGKSVVRRILPTPSQRTSDFKIQVLQKEAGLVLMFDNGDDTLSIRPQKYEQPYIIRIKKEGM